MAGLENNSDVSVVLGAARWADETIHLKDLPLVVNFPQLLRVCKGTYQNIGVPSLANPSLCPNVLLISVGRKKKVAAQCVKFKDGRRMVPFGPKLAIPDTFDGLFELLSEDGKPVRCIESVSELARRFPDACLVRGNSQSGVHGSMGISSKGNSSGVKAYVSRSDDPATITERSRVLLSGEMLLLVGEVNGSGKNSTSSNTSRYLRCFDSKGDNIYLPMEMKARFSAVAKEDSIGGVHSVRNFLSSAKRLPLTVRMVRGKSPEGVKSFVPEMRLTCAYEEECLVAIPIGAKDLPAIFPPLTAPLRLSRLSNDAILCHTVEYQRLMERCNAVAATVTENVHVVSWTRGSRTTGKVAEEPERQIQKELPSPPKAGSSSSVDSSPDGTSSASPPEYDEIDQIYDYVRGLAPLPLNVSQTVTGKSNGVTSTKWAHKPTADASKDGRQPSISKRDVVISHPGISAKLYSKQPTRKLSDSTAVKTNATGSRSRYMFLRSNSTPNASKTTSPPQPNQKATTSASSGTVGPSLLFRLGRRSNNRSLTNLIQDSKKEKDNESKETTHHQKKTEDKGKSKKSKQQSGQALSNFVLWPSSTGATENSSISRSHSKKSAKIGTLYL